MNYRVIWHYRDLRIEDNPALCEAAKGPVIPLYIHCPKEEGKWKRGEASNWWLHHSLEALKESYKEKGIDLLVLSGDTQEVFEKLLKKVTIEAVVWNARYEPHLRKRDKKIAKWLESKGVEVQRFEGNCPITPAKLLNRSGKPYSVYTPFSKAALAREEWRAPHKAPKLEGNHKLKSDTLDLLPNLSWADDFPSYWTPGRKGALKALRNFDAAPYSDVRDFPATAGTSQLSPHLHFGEISPHEILAKTDQKHLPFIKQIIWREFGNYFLYHWPEASDHSWKEKFEDFPWEKNRKALSAWQRGETGYPIVDAGMRELWHTGWMHNRVRMICASFLIKDLFIHWIEGAKWFWDTLVDADLANNTLGWQWVAGSGPDAAPYFRIFNPVLQSQRFDPDGDYIRMWVPELEKASAKEIHAPWESGLDYHSPIVDHSEARNRALAAYNKIK